MRHSFNFWALLFLTPLTLGIYPLVKYTQMGYDISNLDGKSTFPYWVMALFLSGITLGIFPIIWWHRICNRIGALGPSNGFSAGTFWGWNVLGCLILVGPLVFLWKLCNALNSLPQKA